MEEESFLDCSVPNRTVSLENISYHIHGLVHGTSLVRISTKIKEEVNEQLSGMPVICEDGFTSWVRGSVSINEFEYFNLNKFSFSKFILALRELFSHYKMQKEGKDPEIIKEIRNLDSISELKRLRDRLFLEYLPEPQGMNYFMIKHNSGTLDNPEGKIPLRIKRYVYEAKRSIDYAREKNLDELHLVVGCAHELPLEYLFQNPNVLFKLERYLP